jgi:hypothetical protein
MIAWSPQTHISEFVLPCHQELTKSWASGGSRGSPAGMFEAVYESLLKVAKEQKLFEDE